MATDDAEGPVAAPGVRRQQAPQGPPRRGREDLQGQGGQRRAQPPLRRHHGEARGDRRPRRRLGDERHPGAQGQAAAAGAHQAYDGPECPAEFVRTDGSKIDYTVVKKIANPKSKNFGKEYTEQSEQNARYQRMLERVAKKQAEKDKIAAGNALAAGDD